MKLVVKSMVVVLVALLSVPALAGRGSSGRSGGFSHSGAHFSGGRHFVPGGHFIPGGRFVPGSHFFRPRPVAVFLGVGIPFYAYYPPPLNERSDALYPGRRIRPPALRRCNAGDVRRLPGAAASRLRWRELFVWRVLPLHAGVRGCRACPPHASGPRTPRAHAKDGSILPASSRADEPRLLVKVTRL